MNRAARALRHDPPLAVRAGVLGYVAILVILPLGALVRQGLAQGFAHFKAAVVSSEAVDALVLTLWTAAIMAVVNAFMGTATAWVLARYRFWGRAALSALVDLPFAIPTLVAGCLLAIVYGPETGIGRFLAARGVEVVYATPGIILCLLFITVPFVVRAVEPVLLELDPAEEEAARTLGASDVRIFWSVTFPALRPAILSGTVRSFARALGEFGSIVVVAGNIPHRTLTAPVYLFGEIEAGRAAVASAVSIVLLTISLALVGAARTLDRISGGGRG